MQSPAAQKKVNRVVLSLVLLAGGLFFLGDRLLKHWTEFGTESRGGFFYFSYLPNSEGVFGLPVPIPVLIILSGLALLVMTFLGYRSWQQGEPLRLAAAVLMFIGGYSNLLDRLLVGAVIDVWQLGNLSFNLADVYLILGLGIMIW